MACGGLNQISTLDVPNIDQSFGAALDVSSFVADKSIEFHVPGPYAGSFVLYGSHDGTLYVPLMTFDAGRGQQSFKEQISLVARFFKVRKFSPTVIAPSMLVGGQAACNCDGSGSVGANQFLSLAGLDSRSGGGPRPSVDLWTLVASTGIDAVFNVMCGGDFQGLIGIEGSLDNVHFNPIGTDEKGNLVGGFNISAKGSGARQTELSPIYVPNVVRYVRANVQAVINGPVSLTIGGAQNCDCP